MDPNKAKEETDTADEEGIEEVATTLRPRKTREWLMRVICIQMSISKVLRLQLVIRVQKSD